MNGLERRWLERARRLHALATTGQHFSGDIFDQERYAELRGIAEAMLADLADVPVERIAEQMAVGDGGYATPKVDVRAAVIREGHILLVQERSDGRWAMPGGYADVGTSPAANAVKETWEEAGLRVEATRLYACYDQHHPAHPPPLHHFYKLHFLCDAAPDDPAPGHEVADARFFAPDALPDLSVNRTWAKDIARAFAHHADPARAAYFE